jgi:hypothetical protein
MKKNYSWLNHVFNFLAVILGVYLAFFMNERAKMNQDLEESMTLMRSLVNDLSEDIRIYENHQIPVNKAHHQDVERLIGVLMAGDTGDISALLPEIMRVENFAPTTSTYSSMKASGKISLINDLSIQKKLSEYYDSIVIESIRKGEYQVDYFTDELVSWLINNVDLAEMRLLSTDELIILRNKLIIYQSLIYQKIDSYEQVVSDSRELKQAIEAVMNAE